MSEAVLLVHSAGPQRPGEGSVPLAARLGDELGAAYDALFPMMPAAEETDPRKPPPTFLFHRRDEEEVPFASLESYAGRLPDATVCPLDGNGHLFDKDGLTEIVEAIRGLSG